MSTGSATLSDTSSLSVCDDRVTPRVNGSMFAAFDGKRVKVVAEVMENSGTSLKMSASDGFKIFVLVSQDKFSTDHMVAGSVHEIVGKVVSHESLLMERMLELHDVDMRLVNDVIRLTHDARFAHMFGM
ncbi:hypothetical protein C8R47DRAFT_1206636 [Mycena vitilis]|nr:hypothetical protein C8R47DRAFT_1206636 [Mycena vitilis]